MTDPIFDRAPVTEEADGTIAYRASSFGYCIGALVRARLGMTPSSPPDYMLEKYQEGHDWEREVLALGLGVDWIEVTKDSELERFGQVVEGQNGERQVSTRLAWGNKVITCHPDAIVRHGSDKHLRVAEVKFLAEATIGQIERDVDKHGMLGLGAGYAWQASIEMLTTGLPMLYIIGGKKVKVTKDAREVVGVDSILTLEFTEPAFSFRDVKMRVAEVEGWVARGEMPPCVVPFDYPCGYWQEHEARDVEEITDEVLVHLTESYERAMTKKAAHEQEAAEIKREIDGRLTEVGIEGGFCAGWTISRLEPRKGNVSWAKAYKALSQKTGERVDEDEYRGAEIEGGIRMAKGKD